MTEKCVFCKWTRDTSVPNTRFFSVPSEPGIKKWRWLGAIGNREIKRRDKVCSIHFRQGRPSNDPSHEDFVPHLFMNAREPADPEVIAYLEKSLGVPSSSTLKPPPTTKQNGDSGTSAHAARKCPNIIRRNSGKQSLTSTNSNRPSVSNTDTTRVGKSSVVTGKASTDIRTSDVKDDRQQHSTRIRDVPKLSEPVSKRLKVHISQRSNNMATTHRLGEPVILKPRIVIQRNPEVTRNS